MEIYPRERPAEYPFVSEARYRRMWEVAARRQLDLTLVAENVHDAHNVSAVLRSCDAVGVGGVDLVYNQDSFPQLNKAIASSANLWLDIRRHAEIASCYAELRAQGLRIYATALVPEARSPYTLDLTAPLAIVLGNEQHGVSEEALNYADEAIYIPMQGMVQSFNISVAAAIILSEAMRQRLAQGHYELPQALSAAQGRLFGQWLLREEARHNRPTENLESQ